MPFGDMLWYARGKKVKTADNRSINVSWLGSFGAKMIGLPHVGVRERARVIMKNIKLRKNSKILDAGCGIGLYSFALAKKGYDVSGVDFDEEKIKVARELGKKSGINCRFLLGDLTKLKIKGKFDFVICSEVLEHIKSDEKVLKNLSRLLNKKGKIIITVPRIINTYSKYINNYKRLGHVRPGYRDEEIIEKLRKNRLRIIKTERYSYPMTRFALSINEKLYKHQFILGILFYPLYLLSFFPVYNDEKSDGLMIIAEKT